MLHQIEPDLCITYSEDLTKWCDIMSVMKPMGESWDSWKIGAAVTPIKINEGWLVLYHGASVERVYSLGVVLLDKDHPEQLL